MRVYIYIHTYHQHVRAGFFFGMCLCMCMRMCICTCTSMYMCTCKISRTCARMSSKKHTRAYATEIQKDLYIRFVDDSHFFFYRCLLGLFFFRFGHLRGRSFLLGDTIELICLVLGFDRRFPLAFLLVLLGHLLFWAL